MKRNKIWIAIFCIALIASMFSSPVFANADNHLDISTSFKISAPGDTLNMTQEDYLAAAKNTISQSKSDAQKIESTCETFLTLAKASVRDPQNYDCTKLIATDSLKKDTIQYRLTGYKYQSALNKALGWMISKDNLVFKDFKLQKIDKNSAVASVVESYAYYANNGFNDENFRSKMYSFELLNSPDGWLITNVTTDDPWETNGDFVYKPIDVKATVDAYLAEKDLQASIPSISEEKVDKASTASTLYQWTYNTTKAVNYAKSYYNTSNSVFGYTSSNDCQNFASQCVWAGLGGSGSSSTARPAVSTALVGSSAFNVWCRNQSTTYWQNIDWRYDWSWDNVSGFMNLMLNSTSSAEGPYGIASCSSSSIASANIGNVLGVNWDNDTSTNFSKLDHAMFVTAVTGTSGSRTQNNIKVAAHTSATNSAYEVLSDYISWNPRTNDKFGRATITYGYYAIQQP